LKEVELYEHVHELPEFLETEISGDDAIFSIG